MLCIESLACHSVMQGGIGQCWEIWSGFWAKAFGEFGHVIAGFWLLTDD